MKYLRWLLFPFSLLYGLVVVLRNRCYDAGWFASASFDLPVISVGNLAIGGAGKSPMTEYLVRLLKPDYTLATLSRGYGRKTSGFIVAATDTGADIVGDEPAQFKHNFPDVTIAVSEDRAAGIRKLAPSHQLIILDDAYQHRAVKPGFSILLLEYGSLKDPHLLLPAGNLREPFSGRKRADIIVVSKCPATLSEYEQQTALKCIRPLPHQQVFYTSIVYRPLQSLAGNSIITDLPDAGTVVFLLTGIANIKPLVQYLRQYTPHINLHDYPDHHQFTLKNIAKLAGAFRACTSAKKMIITTEKDAQRLIAPGLAAALQDLPVCVLPIGIRFLNDAGPRFDELITNYVRKYTTHRRIY